MFSRSLFFSSRRRLHLTPGAPLFRNILFSDLLYKPNIFLFPVFFFFFFKKYYYTSLLHIQHNHLKTYKNKKMYKNVTPVTPPYEYSKSYSDIYEDYMFRRLSCMPSPAEIDSEEETASDTSSASSNISKDNNSSSSSSIKSPIIMQKSRKSVPHRSPSNMVDQKSVVFQIEQDFPKIVAGGHGGVLWSLRQRVSMARRKDKNRLSAPLPNRRVRAMRIQIPRPQWSNPIYDDLVSPTPQSPQSPPQAQAQAQVQAPQSPESQSVKIIPVIIPLTQEKEVAKPQKVRKNSHATSGRPSRVKGPCQACHETSDGCMRKAFHWPFPTSTIFNDKGKPFVYLCNKCGLR